MYRLPLSDNFESDIAIFPVWTMRIIEYTMSNIYRVSPVACLLLAPSMPVLRSRTRYIDGTWQLHKQQQNKGTDPYWPRDA
jgi:hypothetical protein